MKRLIKKYRKLSFEQKNKLITKCSSFWNFAWSIFKIVFGIIYISYYVCVSGIFTLLIGYSKHNTLKGLNNKKEVHKVYLSTGVTMMVASIIYAIYMSRLIVFKATANYGDIAALVIATISFTSLAVSITGIIRTRGRHTLYRAIKVINFSVSLTDIALTQFVLLSLTTQKDTSLYNGLFGIAISFVILCLGAYMIYKSYQIKNNPDLIYAGRKARK